MEDLDTLVLRTAREWRASGIAVVLVTVARTWGSSPRPPGSLMAINHQGATAGSVSGGCIEDDLIDKVRQGGVQALCAASRPSVLRYGISADDAHRFGLPCGGTIELVLEPVSAISRIDELLVACQQRRSTRRVLDLKTGGVTLDEGDRDGVPCLNAHSLTTFLGPRIRLIIIGAGDLPRYVCQIALSVGFEVIVCDPREQHEMWHMDGVAMSREMPDDLVRRLQPDARTAVITLTHDPKMDDLALLEALDSGAFYIGAIGSRRNTQTRRARLKEHFGFSDAALSKLRGPAGLYIGSKTPAEIALSIMAEIVAAKNGIEPGESVQAAKDSAKSKAGPQSGAATEHRAAPPLLYLNLS
ncbi:XdhC family protein [Xanthomonas arboricola]|uniref:XdhC family protein n=1 Tax=Xanthomonas arboricola TaxID=56448 RepID=UPI00162021B2|nr:XdhC family protein [Xanthomonas arboricola]MBB4596471.1 xanthine dehydrogenase accessory factor [Xanthomonas arboricola]